jgi:hypothetical protein
MLGPLRIPTFSSDSHAEVHLKPGYPTKVLLLPTRWWAGTIILRGSRPSDGRALRFSYGSDPLPPPPFSQEDFERAGTAAAHLRPPPRPLPKVGTWGYTGYMLFPDEGNWRIRAYRNGRLLDTIVVAVTPYSG